ncbi:hypothetical protein [Rhodopirellula bahusiensis]|uniref:Uncharacterized protein n=1 Tax=Rhodopirellula bahusiensis TaxID=2014065 RepID=A0A2G1W5X0_9BACT|nr:hypothetical protein [Rhodopirellula bahusiensis]PHQ34427.1 hypothetical protein CEE69_15575 [Rhodopirellula bahusiensis]
MKSSPFWLASLFVLIGIVPHNRVASADEATKQPQPDATQCCVELSEFELEEPIAIELDESEVIQAILQSGAKPVKTIRLTAMPNTPCHVQKGRQIAVVTSTMTRGDVTTRQTKEVEIGTTLRFQFADHPEGFLANIDYATARVAGDEKSDSAPDILSSSIQTTQVFVPGKMRLISTIGSEQLTAVVVTIHEIHRTAADQSQ